MVDRKSIIDLDAKVQTMKILTVDKKFLESKVSELQEAAATKSELEALKSTVQKLKVTTINGFAVFKM